MIGVLGVPFLQPGEPLRSMFVLVLLNDRSLEFKLVIRGTHYAHESVDRVQSVTIWVSGSCRHDSNKDGVASF